MKTEGGTAIGGVVFALLAAIAFALWNIFLQRGLARGGGPRLALLILALSEVGCFVPISLGLLWRAALPPPRVGGLLWFLLAGLLTSVVGAFLATQATRLIGAAQTTAIRLLDPFFALGIAALFLGETLSLKALAGMALLALALLLLQRDRSHANAMTDRGTRTRGLVYAILTSVAFTVGSIVRKAGLLLVPSAFVAAATEGIAGLLVVGAAVGLGGHGSTVASLRRAEHRDLWWSGLAAAGGTLCLNLALQRVPVPIAVALRNTSPWFALAFIPLVLGRQHRPGRWIWASSALLTLGMLLIVLR